MRKACTYVVIELSSVFERIKRNGLCARASNWPSWSPSSIRVRIYAIQGCIHLCFIFEMFAVSSYVCILFPRFPLYNEKKSATRFRDWPARLHSQRSRINSFAQKCGEFVRNGPRWHRPELPLCLSPRSFELAMLFICLTTAPPIAGSCGSRVSEFPS